MTDRQVAPIQEGAPVSRLDPAHIETIRQHIQALGSLLADIMREGVHYYYPDRDGGGSGASRFPLQAKPSLTDAGAALIRSYFSLSLGGLHTSYETHRDHDPETGHIVYRVRVAYHRYVPVLQPDGSVQLQPVEIAAGQAACSSRETRYAYRWVTRDKVPQDMDPDSLPTRTVARREGGGDPRRGAARQVTLYRIPNPDLADLENTLVKIASKRAEVDATLNLPGVSELFARDMPRPAPGPPVDPETGEVLEEGLHPGPLERGPQPPPPRPRPPARPDARAEMAAQADALRIAGQMAPGRNPYEVLAELAAVPSPERGRAAVLEWIGQGHTYQELLEIVRARAAERQGQQGLL